MKEQIRYSSSVSSTSEVGRQTIWTPRMVESLTSSTQNLYSRGGEIFMAEPGNGEYDSMPQEGKGNNNPIPKESLPSMSPFAKSPDKILDPGLRQYATQFEAKIGKKPLSDWTVEDLKQEYLGLHKLTSKVESQAPTMTGKEQASAETQPYRDLISEELERRGTDLKELFLEALKYAGETAKTVSVGVAPGIGAGAEGEPRRSILAGIEEFNASLEIERVIERLGRQLTPEEVEYFRRRGEALRSFTEPIQRLERAGAPISIETEYNTLYQAVARGEIESVDAHNYFVRLSQIAAGQRRAEQLIRQRQEVDSRVEQIRSMQDPQDPQETQEKRRLLNGLINDLDPDSTRQINIEEFRVIAEDKEASERFLDKIISRPHANPRTAYTLSFYAGINLQTFLTEVRRADGENLARYKRYGELHETTLRFHEMGRAVQYEPGNIDAFMNITRTMNLEYLQIATEIDGAGWVRRLYDQAHGRLYTEKNLIGEQDYDPEINEWVSREFRKLAEAGDVKSHFFGPDGNPRNLENWEIERALAFGGSIHASFFRNSELLSWSSIPHAYQDWLKGVPTETGVKILAGPKWQSYRFRVGATGGGTELVTLLYDKLGKPYRDNKLKLEKIGKLEILKDIIPAGIFRGAGFDSGWRTLQAYLSSDFMKIKMSDPNSYPSSLVKKAIAEFMTEKGVAVGDNVNLGEFLIWQEQKAREMFAPDVRVAGKSMPVELRPSDDPKVDKQMWEILKPLVDTNPQLNLCLGVLIKHYGSDSMVGLRESLWKKTADFLPLRIAYMLSEEGVKHLPWYTRDSGVEGEGGKLFSEQFESKLIKAQELRLKRQKEDTTVEVSLDTFLDEVGMEPREKIFVESLQRLGREKAGELAKISFPHIPFLDDMPFENANYRKLEGSEVFRRRLGDDLKGENDANNAFNTLIDNLNKPYSEILKYLRGIADGIKGPEGGIAAQNVVQPIFLSYLELAEQWVWTRWIPFAKTIAGVFNLPTSWFQKKFGRDAVSADESTLNQMVNQAVGEGVQRRERLPGEKKSQFDQATEHVMAKPINVLIDQLRTLSVIVAFVMIGGFLSRLTKERE